MPKRRKALRELFQATVAAASLASAAARAEELKLPPGTNTANRVLSESVHKKSRTKTAGWAVRVNQEAEAPIREFHALLERMKGLSVHYRESAAPFPQFDEFCKDITIFCEKFADHRPDLAGDITLTPEMFKRIDAVNRAVNKSIEPMQDIQLYGVKEKWMIPAEAGDCEDYVLLKMIRLINEGIDPAYLHIMVVRDENLEGHAILGVDVVVRGARNTLVLDNKYEGIRTLSEMQEKYDGYLASFITRSPEGTLSVRFYPYDSREKAPSR